MAGLGSWINDALNAAGKISADVAPYVSGNQSSRATSSPSVVTPTISATPATSTAWYDQPILVGGIAAGALLLVIGVIVLTRK